MKNIFADEVFHSKIDVEKLWAKIQFAQVKWTVDGTTVLMSNGQSDPITPFMADLCRPALIEVSNYVGLTPVHLMINRLPPSTHVPIHTDTVRDTPRRFHLPLQTSKHAYCWTEDHGVYRMAKGSWYEFNYSDPHAIGNFCDLSERVHLIVDLI